MDAPPTVAVTGACGRIGRALAGRLAARGHPLRLVDLPGSDFEPLAGAGEAVELDLAQPPPPGLLAGVDAVVHLAGDARAEAPWESLLPNNIVASYNVAAAALRAGCRRLILASSVHAVSGGSGRPVTPRDAVAPEDLYGVSKCFAEALAFWAAHQGEMSSAAVRIGAFQTVAASRAAGAEWMARSFIAVPDLVALFERALTADFRFAILHATAPGEHALLDTRETEALLGWRAEHHFPAERA